MYAAHVEMCAATIARGNYNVYMDIMGRVVYNLVENGPQVVTSFPVSHLCFLSHDRLQENTAHAKRAAEVESVVKDVKKLAEEQGEQFTHLAQNIKSSRAIRCPSCKTQDGIFRAPAQLRSGDEGMDTLCFCTNLKCGATWTDRQ
jgi:DNA-directed RNA polymerase subunit M/transcription elongation factor TFIIS